MTEQCIETGWTRDHSGKLNWTGIQETLACSLLLLMLDKTISQLPAMPKIYLHQVLGLRKLHGRRGRKIARAGEDGCHEGASMHRAARSKRDGYQHRQRVVNTGTHPKWECLPLEPICKGKKKHIIFFNGGSQGHSHNSRQALVKQ